MKWTKTSVMELAAIVVMTAVVFTLAILQYRWTGQISGEEQSRMAAALDTSVKKFNQEFSYDMEQLCESFEIDPGGASAPLEARVGHQYADWIASTSRSEFLSGLYIWKTGAQQKPNFESLNFDSKHFEQTAWPAKLRGLQQYLASQNERLPQEMSDRQAVYYPWTFYEDTPALIRPFFGISSDTKDSTVRVHPMGFLIVELSGSFLRRGYLPQLADRYFGQLDFEIAVRSAQAPYQAIYLSTASFPLATASPDAEVNLFDAVAEDARRRGRAPVQSANPALQWQLVAQHPSGSLEAAVWSWRRRNLAISLGLLFVLAASLVLIFSVARRAERFARLQMEFVAGVSHELCTPLAVINSAVENLADGVVDNPGQVQEYVGILRDQGGRLERLLDQVLLFASDKFGDSEFTLRPIAVGPVIAQSLATSEPMLRDAGFVVEKEIAENLPSVVADPEAVNSCLENLISNAMKYAGEKQWLEVRARAVQENSHAEVQVIVEDRGIGIPARDLPHIFEPFYRVQAARDGQIRGVGLGLHLVKRMMEGMGGQVTASSEVGRGTCFVLHFPVPGSADHKKGQAA
jgi:signal transduction histidine kinase